MSSASQRGNWRRTVADVEDIARLLKAGERLMRQSGALLGNSRRGSRQGVDTQGCGQKLGRGSKQCEKAPGPSRGNEIAGEHGKKVGSSHGQNLYGKLYGERSLGQSTGDGEDGDDKLIPGIPDDVSLSHILSKVGWAELLSLSCVSPAWREVITGREVFNARVRHQGTQAFLAIVHRAPRVGPPDLSQGLNLRDYVARLYEDNDASSVTPTYLAISLYNPTIDAWHLLPPIPQVKCGIPSMCACVCVAGRLYVLGGEGQENMRFTPRKTVFVMDLAAGQRVWKQRSSMSRGRSDFACGVIDGKIYAAGGWSQLDHVWMEGEIFDPEKNSWQRIADMPVPRLNYSVCVLNKRMYILGGSVFRSVTADDDSSEDLSDTAVEWAEVYDTRKNRWSRVEEMGSDHKGTWLVMNDQLLSLRNDSIAVHDGRSGSWRKLTSNSWQVLQSAGARFCSARAAADAGGHVFSFVRWLKGWPYEITLVKTDNSFVIQANAGLKKLAPPEWTKVKCPYEFNRDFFFLVPVHL